MASRSHLHKKMSIMGKQEKKLLRVHRRSLDQREMRLEEVNKRRQIDDMSPVVESQDGSKNPSSPVNQQAAAAASRLERLKKWKEERELKRKLEAFERGKSKPGFKVTNVKHADTRIYQTKASHPQKSEKDLAPKPSAGTAKQAAKYQPPAPVANSRAPRTGGPKLVKPVQRSASDVRKTRAPNAAPTKAVATAKPSAVAKATTISPKAAKVRQPSPAKRATRGGHFMAPTAASKARVGVNAKKAPSQPEKKKPSASQLHKVKGASKVTTQRGHVSPEAELPSFAPNDFAFEAPTSLSTFVLKPLSPNSAATFLFPQNGSFSQPSADENEMKDKAAQSTTTPTQIRSEPAMPVYEETGEHTSVRDPAHHEANQNTEIMETQSESCLRSKRVSSHVESDNMSDKNTSAKQRRTSRRSTANDSKIVLQEDSDSQTEVTPESMDSVKPSAKQHRASHRSTAKDSKIASQEDSDSQTEVIPESVSIEKTPAKLRRTSRRSTATTSKIASEEDSNSQTEDIPESVDSEKMPAKQRRTSRRSTATTSKIASEEDSNSQTEDIPESVDSEKMPAKQRRTSRRSTATTSKIASEEDSNSQTEDIPESVDSEKMPAKQRRTSRRSTATTSKIASEEDSNSQTEDIPESMDSEKTPAKRRTSRRSAATTSKTASQEDYECQLKIISEESVPQGVGASQKDSESEMKVISEESAPEGADDKVISAKQRRKSRRSIAAASTGSLQEGSNSQMEVVLEEGAVVEKTKTPRKSRRSCATSLSKAEVQEDTAPKEVVPGMDQADALTLSARKSLRRSRRSVAKHAKEAVSKDMADLQSAREEKQEKVTLADVIATEALLPKMSTPPKPNLCNSQTQDDLFLTPALPVKRSAAKRRRTATMIALSNATSPEEAIKIISTSPMVEMNRRTPKSKAVPELRLNTTAALFEDDEDFSVPAFNLSSVFDSPTNAAAPASDGASSDADAVHTSDVPFVAAASSEADTESASSTVEKPEKRDVTPFRERMALETKKLTDLADHWTNLKLATPDLSDEVVGQIDTTVCYAQLLMGKKGKFHQFAELVDKCEAGDPATTCQDLQGFQDMILIQADDINSKFAQLERLQQNGWQPEVSVATAPRLQPAKKTVKKGAAALVKKKPAGKSKFAAFRAQMMEQRKAAETGNQATQEEKVFEAGFFKVSSPVRSPQYHCEAGTPGKRKVSPCADTTQSASAASSSEGVVTTTTTPKADKENVAHVLLRRSVGPSSGHRRSYIPAVPSPLLHDATAPSSKASPPSHDVDAADNVTQNTEAQENVGTLSFTPKRSKKRRSIRTRKSVCFEPEPAEPVAMETGDKDVEWASYFQPTVNQPTSPLKESVLDNSPFSLEDLLKQSKHKGPDATDSQSQQPQPQTGRRRKSSLKVLPTSERKRLRRSVNFALSPSTQKSDPGVSLPSTPYNRNSLVAEKRIEHHSIDSASPSAFDELQELSNTRPLRRSARPSLLYTPPQKEKKAPLTPAKEVPVATLISFTP